MFFSVKDEYLHQLLSVMDAWKTLWCWKCTNVMLTGTNLNRSPTTRWGPLYLLREDLAERLVPLLPIKQLIWHDRIDLFRSNICVLSSCSAESSGFQSACSFGVCFKISCVQSLHCTAAATIHICVLPSAAAHSEAGVGLESTKMMIN